MAKRTKRTIAEWFEDPAFKDSLADSTFEIAIGQVRRLRRQDDEDTIKGLSNICLARAIRSCFNYILVEEGRGSEVIEFDNLEVECRKRITKKSIPREWKNPIHSLITRRLADEVNRMKGDPKNITFGTKGPEVGEDKDGEGGNENSHKFILGEQFYNTSPNAEQSAIIWKFIVFYGSTTRTRQRNADILLRFFFDEKGHYRATGGQADAEVLEAITELMKFRRSAAGDEEGENDGK